MKRILLVEDDPLLIEIYQTKLKASGYEVHIAQDGEKAIRALQQETPDVMILDLVLPRKDGWEVLEAIRGAGARPKILVLSNLGQKEEIKRAMELGVDKYLIKAHFTPSQVVEELETLFS
ncbi:MAG: response regulator [Candidatus Yanofskybacteria bacterium]|nr:response regulator [Candidatus Yanofskybacteria bacterium]